MPRFIGKHHSAPSAQTVQEIITQGNTRSENHYLWGHSLIQQTRAGQAVFYHADGLGSVKALSDAGGNVTDTYAYDAFGQIEGRSGTTSNAYRYTGEYFDDSISLQFNRARWYDAKKGRFVSFDIWRGRPTKPISLNKYLYANSDPLSQHDPSGRFSSLVEAEITQVNMATLNAIRLSAYFGSAILTAYKLYVLSNEINSTVNDANDDGPLLALTPEQEAQKQAEYDVMYRLTRMPPLGGPNDDCSSLAKNIHHAQAVIDRYVNWDAKWYAGRHAQKIIDWKNRLAKLKAEHYKKCSGK